MNTKPEIQAGGDINLLNGTEPKFSQTPESLIEKSLDMKTLVNLDGELVHFSASLTALLGYTMEDFSGKSVFDIIHADSIKEFKENRRKISKTPMESFYFQHRRLHKNGHWVWCEGTVTNMLHDPCVKTLVSIFRDISEMKIAELREEFMRNSFNDLMNDTSDIMWSVERDFNLTTADEMTYEITELNTGNQIKEESKILSARLSQVSLKLDKEYCERSFEKETFYRN